MAGEKIGSQARVAWAGFPMAGALYGQGDLAAARAVGQEALEVAQRIGELRLTVWLGAFVQYVGADLGIEAAGPPELG